MSYTYISVAVFIFTAVLLLIVFMVLHATTLDVGLTSNEEMTHGTLVRLPAVH